MQGLLKQLTPNLREEYNNSGHIILREVFDNSEVAHLKSIVTQIHKQWYASNEKVYKEQLLVNMHSLTLAGYFSTSDERIAFYNAFSTPKLIAKIEEAFQEDLYFHNSQLFFNPYQNKRKPYWHRDLQYSPVPDEEQKSELSNMLSLHVRIPLVDETGVELIPETHLRWDTELEKEVRLERNNRKNHENLPGAKLIALKAGDVLVFNSQMIHRGNYTLNNERFALDLCIGRPHAFAAKYFDTSTLPTQEELKEIHYPQWFLNAYNISAKNIF